MNPMTPIIHSRILLRVIACIAMSVATSNAQTLESGLAPTLPAASAAVYYYSAKPDELTMPVRPDCRPGGQVNVLGFVKNPGRYEVASSTYLVQLLSYAGGPIQYAKMSDVRITRVIRTENSVSKKEYSVDLEDLESRTDAELELRPGDTIFIDNTGWLTVRDVFTVLTTAAVIRLRWHR